MRECCEMNAPLRRLAVIVLGCLAFNSASPLLSAAEPTLVDLDRDPLLERAIFQRMVEHPDHHVRFSAAGAASNNVDFELGKADQWFIEGQRYGGDLVEAGLLMSDRKLTETGWKVLDWGFARQAADGGFGDTGDPFHSTSFFVEATARALWFAERLKAPDASQRIRHFGPKLSAAAHWMLQPRASGRGLANNRPYTHRRWLVAAAWGLAGRVTKDPKLTAAAAEIAREGISLQQADGVNLEKGGFDVSYQAVGLMFAARYCTVCDDLELRKSIATMLSRGLDYELTKIDAEGQIDTEGSTRVTSETGRSGAAKTVDNKAVLVALVYGAKLLDRPDCQQAAERVARHLRWIKN
jgi:hypothetical protein